MAPVWSAPMTRRHGVIHTWPAGAVEVATGNDHLKVSPLERAADVCAANDGDFTEAGASSNRDATPVGPG
jgi:hypothetical protein